MGLLAESSKTWKQCFQTHLEAKVSKWFQTRYILQTAFSAMSVSLVLGLVYRRESMVIS
jgi:hypothetical protein